MPNSQTFNKHLKIIIAMLVIVILMCVLPQIITCILPFVLAWVVSLIIRPVARIMERLHINRRVAVLMSMLIVIGVISAAVYGISAAVVAEVTEVVEMFNNTRDGIPVFILETIEALPGWLRQPATDLVYRVQREGASFFYPALQSAIPKLGGAAGKIPGMLVFTIVFILAVYFISYDRSGFAKEVKRIIPEDKLAYLHNARKTFLKACGGYVKAQLIIMSVVFFILLVGFVILDVKLAIILAFLICIIDAIPVLGTGIILNPWAVICLIQGNYVRAIGFVCLYIIVLVTRQFIEPRILSHKLGMHPLITLIAMYGGFKLIGVLGMILGPLVTLIVLNIININASESLSGDKEEI